MGAELSLLLDTEVEVEGVTSGVVWEHLRVMGAVSATDLAVTAGWGRSDKEGKVFPGRGKQEVRDWSSTEWGAIKSGLEANGVSENRAQFMLGRAVDVFINDKTKWTAVPERVWEYYLGGYQVLKKWLSYREKPILERDLIKEEAREFTKTVRRLSAIVLLADALDANYLTARDAAGV